MLGLTLTLQGTVIAHCRDADGIVHLVELTTDGLEELVTETNRNTLIEMTTLCVTDESYADELDYIPHVAVYWVNAEDTIPTCVGCVGMHAR